MVGRSSSGSGVGAGAGAGGANEGDGGGGGAGAAHGAADGAEDQGAGGAGAAAGGGGTGDGAGGVGGTARNALVVDFGPAFASRSFTLAIRVWGSNGLARKPSQPTRLARSWSNGSNAPVSSSTGMCDSDGF